MQKRKRIRVKAWTDAARGEQCTIQLPAVCNGDRETVVAAHSNMAVHGKGTSRKADDLFIAFACSACHHAIDEGHKEYDLKLLREHWHAGHARTLRILWDLGLLNP